MDILLIISRLLSYGIILGALILKVPQILKVTRARSAKGLALSSYWMETFGYAADPPSSLPFFLSLSSVLRGDYYS